MKTILLLSLTILLNSCAQSQKNNSDDKMENKNLIENVKLAVNPRYQDWVLFRNGTYIIFDDIDTIANLKVEAIKQMKEFGPVFQGGPAGDFGVTHLNRIEGWVVSGHGYGMYTYVNPSEIKADNPTDLEIGIFGRGKRNLDGKNPEIIYVNNKQ